ncbi:MAG: signal peptidase I [Acutalibacteraceae bacterium]|jgi:signal peptidase I|nr:signal peptidase I [Acutalibacteraceae bacterium]
MEDFEIYEVGNKKNNEKSTFKADFFDWLEILVTAIVLLVVLFTFIFKVVTIDGPSMENTLHNGERIVISNIGADAKSGDIVVISRNQNNIVSDTDAAAPIIKRVIATEGQIVDIDFETGVVYVDGVALDESYVKTPTNVKFDINFPVSVPEDCVFVLGDNRNNSTDSRSSLIGDHGMIDKRYILGKVVLRVLPFDKFGRVE